jgi:phage I-like protein
MPKKQRIESAHCVMALNAAGNGLSRTINLLPKPLEDGTVPGRDGRYWKLSNPDAVLAASNTYAKEFGAPLDEGHKMYFAPGSPAFGWFQSYAANGSGGIDGLNELNNLGANAIDNKHYRYASVVFDYDFETLEILVIKGAGLTNNQNLQVQALNNQLPARAGANKEDGMLKALLTALGLREDATQEQALNTIQGLQQAKTALNSQGEVVPKADHVLALNRAQTAETALLAIKTADFKAKVETAINTAVKDGKLSPATKPFWEKTLVTEQALNDFQQDYLGKAPVLTAEQTAAGGAAPGADTALNAAEAAMAKTFGNSAEDLAKYGK